MSDKTPIEPGDSYASGGISIGKFSFRMREMIIAVGLVVVVVMCFVFLGLFSNAHASGNSNGGPVPAGLVGNNVTAPLPTLDPKYCTGVGCIRGAGYVRGLMNVSVDPCEDFYTYACGNWPNKFPLKSNEYYSSVSQNLYEANQKKIIAILESSATRQAPWAAERKIKDLYYSCMDDYGRMVAGGNPLTEKVLNHIGGFWLVADLPSNWDILSAVEKVHVDFWTNVLFNVYVGYDYYFNYRYRRPIITISNGGLGMGSSYYYTGDYNANRRLRYRNYMIKMAGLLARDSGVAAGPALDAKINTFVADVISFETKLANITNNEITVYSGNTDIPLYRLNNQTHNLVNWTSFMAYLFDKAPISRYTRVRLRKPNYFISVVDMISNLPSDSRNRILNNYMVWQIAKKYAGDLSYEYIALEREYYTTANFYRYEPPDIARYCFYQIRYDMDKILSHLFVRDHFSAESKREVQNIASTVKQSIIEGIASMVFMNKTSQDYGKRKLKASLDRIGYPDWIMDEDQIDLIYYQLNVTKTNFFHNLMSLNAFDKEDLNNRYLKRQGETHVEWTGTTFDQYLRFYYYNQMRAPSGVLQDPNYNSNKPSYLNFGGIGTMFAYQYFNAINRAGSYYGIDGKRLSRPGSLFGSQPWWGADTTGKFRNATICYNSFYENKTAGSYKAPNGTVINVPVSKFMASSYSSRAAQESGAIKYALNAYQIWQKKYGRDKMPPALDLSNEQMFFLAYGQTKCTQSRPYNTAYPFYRYFPIPDSMKLNGAMATSSEFSKAFGCSTKATLNPTEKCTVY